VARAAVLLAGFWLGLLVATWIMAGVNLRMADRVLGSEMRPEVAARLEGVAPDDRRMVLRHMGGEINRWMFRRSAWLNLVLGLGFLALVWTTPGAPRVLAVVALLLTLLQAFGLAGAITRVGRAIEFLPHPVPGELGRRFGLLHGAYVLADFAKAGAIAAAAVLLLRRP
jgi:hypothetical protein